MRRLLFFLPVLAWLLSCSVTSRLPEDTVLYTGVDRISEAAVGYPDSLPQRDCQLPQEVREAVGLTLEVAPTESFLGSAYHMSPLPFGLWIYNGLYTKRTTGLRHWLWNRFKADPLLLRDVNPELRCRVAESTLLDHGYFDAEVSYQTLYAAGDSSRAKVRYQISHRVPWTLSSIDYFAMASPRIDSIVRHTLPQSYLRVGERFSSDLLQAERDRLVQTLRDSGYCYYAPSQIRFLADTTAHDRTVALRVYCCAAAQEEPRGLLPCTLDSIRVTLDWGTRIGAEQHDTLGIYTQHYSGPQYLRPQSVRDCFPIRPHVLYRPDRLTRAQSNLSRLNTFKYVQLSLDCLTTDPAADTLSLCVRTEATNAAPWQGKLDASFLYKDNDQIGPAFTLNTIRRNLFHGGETFSATFHAGYEWTIGSARVQNKGNVTNSYDFGIEFGLSSPRLYLPDRLLPHDRRLPVSTHIGLSFAAQARAGFFSQILSSAEITYGYYSSPLSHHAFTPIRLSHSRILRTTAAFDAVLSDNVPLRQSFEDRLIPQVQYTYTYDDTQAQSTASTQHYLQFQVSEAGGLCQGLSSLIGHQSNGSRKVLGQTYSQFVRASADYRYYRSLSPEVRIATRLLAGAAYAYGNSRSIPYTEAFYVGGPNSLRGFSIRGVGPGTNRQYRSTSYGYLMRVGDLKLEGNAELRFPLLGDIHGALFADAGNVWRLRGHDDYPGGDFLHGLGDLATDAGFGLRYDLGMLVVRFDIGLPLHDPGRSGGGYFNCQHALLRQMEYNLAIGYPF